MSFAIAPLLTTPLLKIPILASNAAFSYYAFKPPHSTEPLEMRRKFTWSDYLTSGTRIQLRLAALLRTMLAGLALAEAATIVAEEYPHRSSSELVDYIIQPLLSLAGSAQFRVTSTFLAGSALVAAGGLLRVYCHRTLGKLFAWQVGVQADHRLITTGPYSVVRHPGYTALALLGIGAPLALLSSGSYAVEIGLLERGWGKAAMAATFGWLEFVVCALMYRIDEEERELDKRFGVEWRAWAEKTPYRLIPFVY